MGASSAIVLPEAEVIIEQPNSRKGEWTGAAHISVVLPLVQRGNRNAKNEITASNRNSVKNA